MPPLIDLTKQTFGRLVVIKRAANGKNGNVRWKCQCSCGNITTVYALALRRNNGTKSCGCLNIEHGMRYTPEYLTWINIIQRCTNSNRDFFKYYGGRGITVCDEWRHDFMAFYNYVGPKPSPDYSIDRIDNNGNYEPDNVRWATPQEQVNNRRNNHNITIHRWTMTLTQWAHFVGKSVSSLRKRFKLGWPSAKAIFQPIRHHKL